MKKLYLFALLAVGAFATASAEALDIPTTSPSGLDLNKCTIENNSPFHPTVKDNGSFDNLDYFGEGDVAIFTLNNTKEAAYEITFEAATPQQASNVDFVLINAAGETVYNENAFIVRTGETGGDWSDYELNTMLPETPVLPLGTYTLKVTLHEGTIWDTYTANIRYIKFTAIEAQTPEVPEGAQVIPTTDDKGLDLNKCTIENNSPFHPTVKDNGTYDNLDYFGEGDVAIFSLFSSIETAYSITFEAATPQQASNVDFQILNAAGESVYNENVFIVRTGETGGDWSDYEVNDMLPATPVLPVGVYTLKVTLHEGTIWDTYTANIRYIKFAAASGISDITTDATEGRIFNLQGIEVNSDYKGLVIKNGKKYIQR